MPGPARAPMLARMAGGAHGPGTSLPDVEVRVEVRLLGPLSVDVDGRSVTVPGRLARALLALLALQPGRPMAVAAIVDRLWHEPPPSCRNTLQTYVAHLRRALDPRRSPGAPSTVLETDGGGYRLLRPAVNVDAERFEQRVLAVRSAPGPAERLAMADAALELWRGEPLADLGDVPFAVAERARLGELAREARQVRVEALIDVGRCCAAIIAADAALGADPYDEAMWRLAVLARYRAGRPADALAAHRRARHLLASELGLEPSAPLRALEGAVLAHDPTLLGDLEPAPPAAAGPAGPARAPLTVVVAEDDLLVREGVVRLLGREHDVAVLAAVGTYDEALDSVDRFRPDALVTDIRMPPRGRDEGIRIAAEVRRRHPGLAVVVLSQLADPHYARCLFSPTAARRGYLLKEHVGRPHQLLDALRTVVGGGSYLDPTVVELLVAPGGPRGARA